MKKFKNELNSSEKFARNIVGIDTEANFNTNERSAEEILEAEKIALFNEKVELMESRINSHMQEAEDACMKLAQELNGVDIAPLYGYVLIKPFERNPFQKIKTDEKTGLILDTGGITPEYKSEEDGEMHLEEELIKVGMVIETGHKCEFVKQGDLVFYNAMASAVNVPFYRLGLVAVNEQRIIAAVNDDVTARKMKLMNNGD